MGNIVLLTGEPRVGKTTVIKKIIQMIGKENCMGFFTEEVCNETGRTGFDCVSLEGDRIRIADVSLESDIRIGRYGIDIDGFEGFALKIIDKAINTNHIIIIDEIGPMQLLSCKFEQELLNLLDGAQCILATIFYEEHSKIDEIKRFPGVKLFTLTTENRNIISDIVTAVVKESIKIVYTNGSDQDFVDLCKMLDDNLNEIVGGEQQRKQYVQYNLLSDIHDVYVAYLDDLPVACASFKQYDDQTAEVKRVFVRKEHRGKGISKQLMNKIEDLAKRKGFTKLILETGACFVEAQGLYKKLGYEIIDNYGQYKGMKGSICMQKEI